MHTEECITGFTFTGSTGEKLNVFRVWETFGIHFYIVCAFPKYTFCYLLTSNYYVNIRA